MSEEKPGLIGQIREKLVSSKEKWAREGRLLTGKSGADRLPPGQRLVRDWPVLDLGIQPLVATEDWSLTVDGAVENPLTWDWRSFRAAPQAKLTVDIHCVTAWSRYDNRFEGVTSRHLIDLVKPKPEARHVIFHAHDGYTTNVALPIFADEDVLIAHSWEGEPLTRQHGGPARIVIPKFYFWKSAKWVRRIEFTTADKPGFWEVRGYHNEGDPWKEDRYS